MLPVCSAAPCCSSHSQISFGGLRCFMEDRSMSIGTLLQRISSKTQAARSLYSTCIESNGQSVSINFLESKLDDVKCKINSGWSSSSGVINEIHHDGRTYLESYNISAVEEGAVDLIDQSIENVDSFTTPVEPDFAIPTDVTPESPTFSADSLDVDSDSLSKAKTSFDDFLSGSGNSINASMNKGGDAVKNSLDTFTSSITSLTKSASEAVDNAISGVFSTVNQTGELAGNKLNSFSSDLQEATSKAAVASFDILRDSIVAVEKSIGQGASFVVYSYGSAKDLLPAEIRDVLNASEERVVQILRPVGSAFQQVYIGIEGFEKNLGFDPNDPLVPFVLLLGTSATLWAFYWVWAYGGYSGDLSPQSTLELLSGKENAVLIDVRPEVLREKDGIPDLRRTARFRYTSVTLPEVDGPVRKLLKGGREVDDALIAVVIRNLKAVKDRSKVIVMDANGTRSKGVARSLRKLGVKRPYMVQGGFQLWVKQGLRIKELKEETALTILNEEAEAILEDINPTPVQFLGYGVGFAAATYALIEWEKTLQIIGIVGIGQTIYRRVSSYNNVEDFKQDVRRLLTPVTLGTQAFSWAAGKLENNRIGLPTSPSSSDVQNRVLQAAAKHESQPSSEGIENPSPGPATPITEGVDLSEA